MLTLNYNKVREYYNFYKNTNWRESQINKGILDDVLTLSFIDNIVVNDNLISTTILIKEFVPHKFDVNIFINLQKIVLKNQTLKQACNWVNNTFKKPFCIECSKLLPINKSGKCVECLNKECISIDTDKTCSVCLLEVNRNVYRTLCNHFFHTECVKGVRSCPNCRFNFYEDFELAFSDSDSMY